MKEIENYFINYETLLILPYGSKKSKVYELDEVFIVNTDVVTIVKNSCLYFGSSLEGRKEGTKSLLNCEIKVPIIIEDSKNLIMFPTSSYKSNRNVWISYNNLLKYSKYDGDNTLLCFKENNDIKVNIKYNIIDNQIIRCIKLDAIINKRKNGFFFDENN